RGRARGGVRGVRRGGGPPRPRPPRRLRRPRPRRPAGRRALRPRGRAHPPPRRPPPARRGRPPRRTRARPLRRRPRRPRVRRLRRRPRRVHRRPPTRPRLRRRRRAEGGRGALPGPRRGRPRGEEAPPRLQHEPVLTAEGRPQTAAGTMPEGYTLDTLAEHVGRELGVSGWRTVDQATIDAFADVTGDHQWIHVDVERARHESPHGATIAHGLLTLSLLPAMRAEVGVVPGGVGRVLNYGYDRIRFLAP